MSSPSAFSSSRDMRGKSSAAGWTGSNGKREALVSIRGFCALRGCSGGFSGLLLCSVLALGFRDGAQQPLHRAIPALARHQQKLALTHGGDQAILGGPIALRAA